MSTVKSRRDQFSEATRAALLDAAARRFADLGFAGTSLEDVAADIRATRGAVYHHFASKQALFEAVLEQQETEAVRRAEEAGMADPDPWNSALLALNSFLDHCLDPMYSRLVWQEAPVALGWLRWEELESRFACGLIDRYVRRLNASGHLVAMPIEATTDVVFHMLGAAGQALAKAPEEKKAEVRDEYAVVLVRLLAGVRASAPDASGSLGVPAIPAT